MNAQAVSSAAPRIDVSSLAVCRGLARQATSRIMAVSTMQKKAAGETLFGEGDVADGLYEVVSGTLRLYKLLPDGRRQITGFLGRGQILGLAPEGTHVYTAEAITNITVCRYARAALDRLVDELPGLARRLLAVTSHELRAAQDQMLLLGRKSATEKVASFLLMMANRQNDEDTGKMFVPMTRNDIADYLGLTIETVSRTLSKLKSEGLIALPTPHHIEIRDDDRLQDFASGEMASDL